MSDNNLKQQICVYLFEAAIQNLNYNIEYLRWVIHFFLIQRKRKGIYVPLTVSHTKFSLYIVIRKLLELLVERLIILGNEILCSQNLFS